MTTIEYGIRIKVDGNKIAADSFDQITQSTLKTGDAAATSSKKISDAQQEVAASAAKLSQSYTNVGEAVAKSGAVSQQVAQKIVAANQQAAASGAQLNKEQQRFIDSLSKQSDSLGKTNSQLAMMRAQQLGVADAAAPMIAKLAAAEQGIGRVGMSAAATAAAMRNVPAQFTDIVTSLQGGQSPMTVFMQQGGQLKDMFGGMGNAAKALGTYVLGLISPLTVGAAAVGVLAFACYQGSKEIESYQRTIIMTGNVVGVTADRLADIATKLSETGKSTKGAASEALVALVSTGNIASENLERFASVSVKMQKVIGMSVGDVAKDLSELGKSPLEASKKLSEQYHYLTKDTYDQIKALLEHGKTAEGAAVAQTAYINSFDKKSEQIRENLGVMDRAWNSVRDSAQGAWDAMLDIKRKDTDGDNLKRIRIGISNREYYQEEKRKTGNTNNEIYKNTEREIALLHEEEKALQAVIAAKNGNAAATGKTIRADEEARKQSEKLEAYINAGNHQTKAQALKEEAKKFDEATAGLTKTSEGYRQAVAANAMAIKEINEKFKEKNHTLNKQESAYQSLILTMKEKFAASQAELTQNANLTEGQKLRIKFDTDLREGKIAATAAEREFARSLASQIDLNNVLAVAEKAQAERTKKFKEEFAAKVEASFKMVQATDAYITSLAAANEQAQLEVTLLGKTETERKIAIEQFKIELGLRKQIKDIENSKGFDADKPGQIQRATLAADKRKQEIVVEVNTDDILKARKELDAFLDPTKAQSFGDALVSSLNNAGNALQKLSVSLQEYARSEAEINKFRKDAEKNRGVDPIKYAQDVATLNEKSARAQIQNYASIAGAAKSFFAEGSRGYKALEAIEKVYQTTQLAMNLASVGAKLMGIHTVTAATVAGEATKSAAVTASVSTELAANAVKGASAAAVGVATQATGDPYTAIPRMAAMAAIMAALGFATGFFGNSGGGGMKAEDVQKQQGTGAVFGDATAKSDSIAKSIEDMSKNSNRLLPVNQGMLAALKNIESSMAGFTNFVVRDRGVIDGSNLGVRTGTIDRSSMSTTTAVLLTGIMAPVTKWLASLWGKTTQNVVDSGVQFGGRLTDLQAGKGFSQYASVDTTSSSWFGLKKSTSNSVQSQGLSAELSSQLALIFTGMSEALKEANKALGGTTDEIVKTLNNLTLSSEKVSLKGLSGQALTDALNSVISKSLDEMAQAAFPQYDQFRAVGEGYAQTVLRVANTVSLVNDSLGSVGAKLFALNEGGINAAVGLSKLFDGVENLQSATSFFAENFLSDAERIAPVAEKLHQRMAELGYGSVTTEAGFKNLVLGLDLTNSSQADLYVELLKLAPAFKAVADSAASSVNAVDTARQQVDDAKRNFQSALRAVGDALEGVAQKAANAKLAEQAAQEKITAAYFNAQDAVAAAQKKIIDLTRQSADSMKNFSGNLRTFIASINGSLDGQSYSALKATLSATANAAKNGDVKAQNELTGIAQRFLDASKEHSPSATAYSRDAASVRSLLGSVADVVDAKVRAMNLPPVAEPMEIANKELLDAQERLLKVSLIAAASGASVERSMVLVAGSTSALLAEFQKAHADNVKAQADYATAKAMSSQFAIPDMGSLNGFLSLMSELSAAKTSIVKAEADLSAAIIKSAKTSEVTSADFAKSLGLTGDSAALLSKAMVDAHLTTAGYKALMSSTGLNALELATDLLQSGIAATDMAVILAKAGNDGESFADRLRLAGIDATQFAANLKQSGLKSDSLALIFDASKSAADVLANSLGITSGAAANLATWLTTASYSSGEVEKKFASVGVSTDKLNSMLAGSGLSASDFFKLLSIAGGSATSLNSLLDTTGLSGSGVNVGKLLTAISGTTSTAATLADLLKLTGGDAVTAAQLANNIKNSHNSLQDFLAILSGTKTTATDFNDFLSVTGVSAAAILSVLGTGDTGLQGIAIAAGTSLSHFAATAKAANTTISGFDAILAKSGLTASSFDGLKKLTGATSAELSGYLNLASMSSKDLSNVIDTSKQSLSTLTAALFGESGNGGLSGAASTLAAELLKQNVKAQTLIDASNESSLVATNLNNFGASLGLAKNAADYVTQLLNSFKLPTANASGSAKSLNQQLVEDWYKTNPNAIKTTDLQGIAYWVQEIEKSGVIAAKTAFSNAVAKTTNTIAMPINEFSVPTSTPLMPPALATQNNDALIAEIKSLNAKIETLNAEVSGLRDEQRIGDQANVRASKSTTQFLQSMSNGKQFLFVQEDVSAPK